MNTWLDRLNTRMTALVRKPAPKEAALACLAVLGGLVVALGATPPGVFQ